VILTRKQKQILDYVTRFIDEKGYSPSLMEIGGHFGLRSPATVHKHVENLRRKGLVRKAWNSNRSLELTRAATGIRAIRLPLAGRVAAGKPIEAIEQREMVAIPESMLGKGDCFVLQVRGDSMIDEHIRDGDFVVVEKRARVKNGEVVVALVDEDEATLKTFQRDGARVKLLPANGTMAPLVLPAERVRVQGVVIGLLRQY